MIYKIPECLAHLILIIYITNMDSYEEGEIEDSEHE